MRAPFEPRLAVNLRIRSEELGHGKGTYSDKKISGQRGTVTHLCLGPGFVAEECPRLS